MDHPGDLVHAHRDPRHRDSRRRRSRPATRCSCCTRRPTATRTSSAPTPMQFDVGRDPNHEVALGFGPHFCLGAALARIEIAAMLEALLDRFSSIEPAGDGRAHRVVRDRRHLTRAGRVPVSDDHARRLGVPRRCRATRLARRSRRASRAIIAAPDGIEAAVVLARGRSSTSTAGAPPATTCSAGRPLPCTSRPEPRSRSTASTGSRARAGGDGRRRARMRRRARRPSWSMPADVVIHDRGRPGWQREVHDIIADTVPAQRLLVGETFNEAGQWSSFPPHKHDGGDGEPALEEVYYYRFDRPDGFGFQGLYEHADGSERRGVPAARRGRRHPARLPPGVRGAGLPPLLPVGAGTESRHRARAGAPRRSRAPLAARPAGRLTARKGPTASGGAHPETQMSAFVT